MSLVIYQTRISSPVTWRQHAIFRFVIDLDLAVFAPCLNKYMLNKLPDLRWLNYSLDLTTRYIGKHWTEVSVVSNVFDAQHMEEYNGIHISFTLHTSLLDTASNERPIVLVPDKIISECSSAIGNYVKCICLALFPVVIWTDIICSNVGTLGCLWFQPFALSLYYYNAYQKMCLW